MAMVSQNDAIEMTFSLKLDKSLFCNYLKGQLESHKENLANINHPLCKKNFSIVEQESHESLGTLIMKLASSFDCGDESGRTNFMESENHKIATEELPIGLPACEKTSSKEADKQTEEGKEKREKKLSSTIDTKSMTSSSCEVSVQTETVVVNDGDNNHRRFQQSRSSSNIRNQSPQQISSDVTEKVISDVAIKTEPENVFYNICDYDNGLDASFENSFDFGCQNNELSATNSDSRNVGGFQHQTNNEETQNEEIFNDWSNAYDGLPTGANNDNDDPFQAISNQIESFKTEINNENDSAYGELLLENIVSSEFSQPCTSQDRNQHSNITYLDGFEVANNAHMVAEFSERRNLGNSVNDANFSIRSTPIHSMRRAENSSISETELDGGEIFEVEKDTHHKEVASRQFMIPASRGQAIKSASFKCNICEYKTQYYPLIQNHLFKSHQKKINVLSKDVQYECKLCLYRGENAKNFKDHFRRQHYNARSSDAILIPKNRCKFCKFEAYNKISLREHVKRRHADKIPEIVDTVDTSSSANDGAMMAEKLPNYLSCHLCPFQTNWRRNLLQHFKEFHAMRQQIVTSGIELDKIMKFKCNLCFYSTFKKFNLKTHVQRVHAGELAASYEGMEVKEGHELKLFAHIEYPEDLIKLQRPDSSDANGQVIGGFGDPNALELSPGGVADVEQVEPPEVEEIRNASTTTSTGPPYKCPLCPFTTNAKSPLNVHTSRFHKFTAK